MNPVFTIEGKLAEEHVVHDRADGPPVSRKAVFLMALEELGSIMRWRYDYSVGGARLVLEDAGLSKVDKFQVTSLIQD